MIIIQDSQQTETFEIKYIGEYEVLLENIFTKRLKLCSKKTIGVYYTIKED